MTLKARKKAGDELLAKYHARAGNNRYSAAVDVIADVLLAIAQNDADANKILHAAEAEFRNASELETFASEG
jgi:hypothetical protein